MKNQLRILFIEDNEQDLAMLLAHFARSEYAVTYSRVETDDETIAALKHKNWDVIISDYYMPEFSGIEALRIVQSYNVDCPFIIVSGNIGEETAVEAMKAGANDYIFKGNLKRLIPAITRELREVKAKREHKIAQLAAQNAIRDRELQLRALAAEVSLAEERNRRLLATALHDHISQVLAFAKMEIRFAMTETDNSKTPERLIKISEYVDKAYQQTKTLTFELSPPILYDLGLASAVDWLVEQFENQHGLEINITQDDEIPVLQSETAIVMFSAVRELLNNIVKHANTKKVDIRIYCHEDNICIYVKDDGIGCDISKLNSQTVGNTMTFGLFSLRERVQYMGGSMTCVSANGQGTQITVSMPINIKLVRQ